MCCLSTTGVSHKISWLAESGDSNTLHPDVECFKQAGHPSKRGLEKLWHHARERWSVAGVSVTHVSVTCTMYV